MARVRSPTVYRTFTATRRREQIRITDDVTDAVREAARRQGAPGHDL
jgi:hypothetical protein